MTSISSDLPSLEDQDDQLVQKLRDQVAELKEDIQRHERNERIQNAVFEIARTPATVESIEEFYKSIHQVVAELTSIDAIIIALYHDQEECLSFPYYEDQFDDEQQDDDSPLKNRGLIPIEKCKGMLTWQVLSTNEVIRINEDTEPNFTMFGKNSHDWLGIPLQRDGKPIGVFAIQSYQEGFRYRETEVDLMVFISRHISTALQHVNNTEAIRGVNQELKESAAQLEESNMQLKQQIEEREEINRRLVELSHQAGKAEIATGVLHNVGNVLNSINVSAALVEETLRASRIESLKNAAQLINDQEDLSGFFSGDKRGEAFPFYLKTLAEKLEDDREAVMTEMRTLKSHLEHVKTVVSMQQANAGISGLRESVTVPELFRDAEILIASSLSRHEVEIERDFAPMPNLLLEKQKLLQVIVNLLKNAKDSMTAGRETGRLLKLSAMKLSNDRLQIDVTDNGEGIAPENLTKMFSHGFTTKEDGHGFGLHSCANAMKEMGGQLTAHSDGCGKGATFRLQLPYVVAEDQQKPNEELLQSVR